VSSWNPFSIILIWLLAGAIVAMGLKELHQMHGKRAEITQAEVDALIKKLKGDQRIIRPEAGERASYIPEEKVSEVTSSVEMKAKDVLTRIFPEKKP
jgi:hypothetical protein